MSSPVSTTSWQGALRDRACGFIAITVLQQRQHVERLAPAAGRLGLAQEGERLAELRAAGPGSRSMPQATRSTVPNRLTSTGMS